MTCAKASKRCWSRLALDEAVHADRSSSFARRSETPDLTTTASQRLRDVDDRDRCGGRGRGHDRDAASTTLVALDADAARSTDRAATSSSALAGRGELPARARRLRCDTVSGPTDHVVIVGAGLGGLSAALRLAGAGRRVTVLERELVPGGRAGLLETRRLSLRHRPDRADDARADRRRVARASARTSTTGSTLRRVEPAYRARFADGSTST